jgi:hypothetical protein
VRRTASAASALLAAVLQVLEAMEAFASASAAVSSMPLLSPARPPLMHKIGDVLPSSLVSPASPTSTSAPPAPAARRRLLSPLDFPGAGGTWGEVVVVVVGGSSRDARAWLFLL